MKKRYIGLWLSVLLLLSCFGCGTDEPDKELNESKEVISEVVSGTEQEEKPTPIPEPTATPTPEPTATPTPKPSPTPTKTTPPQNSSFEVHYIDVGQADASLVLCDGAAMLIDGGNSADSSLIYSYLKSRAIDHLDYIVCTHAQEDHAGGLSGALNYATVDVALCPVTDDDNAAFQDFVKFLGQQSVSITVPTPGDSYALGSATIQVLGPISMDEDEPNNTSIVLRVVYGETSFLFTGDAEREEEQEILDAGYMVQSTVLKIGHHGSSSSTSYRFLREVMPLYAVIHVGADNSYGHPTDEVLSRLRDADVKVYRTDLQGSVICTSDGSNVEFTVERNANIDTLAPPTPVPEPTAAIVAPVVPFPEGDGNFDAPAGTEYVLNTNTLIFHCPDCKSVKKMKDKNKQYFTGTREEVLSMGYSPCGNCKP